MTSLAIVHYRWIISRNKEHLKAWLYIIPKHFLTLDLTQIGNIWSLVKGSSLSKRRVKKQQIEVFFITWVWTAVIIVQQDRQEVSEVSP